MKKTISEILDGKNEIKEVTDKEITEVPVMSIDKINIKAPLVEVFKKNRQLYTTFSKATLTSDGRMVTIRTSNVTMTIDEKEIKEVRGKLRDTPIYIVLK